MKAFHIFILSLICSHLFAQEIREQEVKSTVKEVTVFLEGAQVVREEIINIPEGTTMLKFTNLSPFIDAKSIQVKAVGELTVLSVNHQKNFINKVEKSAELTRLEGELDKIQDKIELENTYSSIVQEEIDFLLQNRQITGKNDQVSVTNLQQAAEFYGKKLTELKLKQMELYTTLEELDEQRDNIYNQIKTITSKTEYQYPTGEILVKTEAKRPGSFKLRLTYMVSNAGWFPSYDIRAKNINEPVQLIYKANVKQDTKVDWTDVKLKFSSATPSVSGLAPSLQTYFLNYYAKPPQYSAINTVYGRVLDQQNGEPLIGVNIMIKGTTIGTTTDVEGNYSLTVPQGAQLIYSMVGYETEELPVTTSNMNLSLTPTVHGLYEIQVVGYGVQRKKHLSKDEIKFDIDVALDEELIEKESASIPIPIEQVNNQTTVDFEIQTPYTIKSDNKSYAVDMANYNITANYQYYSIPKIDRDAFLMAQITNWEQYNLLEAEANVFFEDTYIGKTLLDVRNASDTLEISLGRDKQVTVQREKLKEYTERQFIGNKKEESRAWKTTVKNNKNQAISMIILDQVPVSTLEEIEILIEDISGGRHNYETGEVKWEFELKPGKEKTFDLKYTVKYPKNRSLVVE